MRKGALLLAGLCGCTSSTPSFPDGASLPADLGSRPPPTDAVTGTWHLTGASWPFDPAARFDLVLTADDAGALTGSMRFEGGFAELVDRVAFDAATKRFALRSRGL